MNTGGGPQEGKKSWESAKLADWETILPITTERHRFIEKLAKRYYLFEEEKLAKRIIK